MKTQNEQLKSRTLIFTIKAFSFLVLSMPSFVMAQGYKESTSLKHQINVGLNNIPINFNFCIFPSPFIGCSSSSPEINFQKPFLYQISYKNQMNVHMAFRTGLNFNYVHADENSSPYFGHDYKNLSIGINAGFELKSDRKHIFKPYIGFDVAILYVETSIEEMQYFFKCQRRTPPYQTYLIKKKKGQLFGFGAGPVWGVEVYITDKFSLATEIGFIIYFARSKWDDTVYFVRMECLRDDVKYGWGGYVFGHRLLGLTLNYHF